MKEIIATDLAPKAIGPYSQAVKINDVVYLSGQIPLDPDTMNLVKGDFSEQVNQVFRNLTAVAEASGGNLSNIVKLTIYLIDLQQFVLVNEIMKTFFSEPYPARSTIQVSALPKGAEIEIDAIMSL